MCIDTKLYSFSMGSSHEKSAEKKAKRTSLTLFEDLLDSDNAVSTNVVQDSCPSDCESGVSGPESEQQAQVSSNGLIRISDGEMIHEAIKKKLVSSLSSIGFEARLDSIHRTDQSSIINRAKLQSFCIYSKAIEMKCGGGNGNVKYAWYGASKSEISGILYHGFGFPTVNRTNGQGVHLSPVEHPAESLQFAKPDEDGIKHMLLCRVIMGKMEEICPNAKQHNPSCEEFDSGVDNLSSPRKYIIWGSRMNTHILPEFVVSFRASSLFAKGNQQTSRRPNSDWMPFPSLIMALSKFMPSDAIESITKHHNEYRKQKLTRFELIQRVRHIAGDNLLMAVIKSYRGKIKSGYSN